jgi:phosphoglycolate phosphatase-like HAD superfamily hydrolase
MYKFKYIWLKFKTMVLEGIIFDNDGVLSRTAPRQYEWFQFWAKQNDKKLPFSDFDEFIVEYNQTLHEAEDVGCGVQAFYDHLELPCDMKDKSHPVWAAYNEFKVTHPTGLVPGMKATLKEIYKIGALSSQNTTTPNRLRIGVNSTNTWETIGKELEKAGVIQYFDAQIGIEMLREIHGAGDGNALKKPSKVSVAHMLYYLGTAGDNTMHVGDTRADLAASKNVLLPGGSPTNRKNLIMVGTSWGYEGRDVLEQGTVLENGTHVHFDYIIDKPKDLVWLVKKHRGS